MPEFNVEERKEKFFLLDRVLNQDAVLRIGIDEGLEDAEKVKEDKDGYSSEIGWKQRRKMTSNVKEDLSESLSLKKLKSQVDELVKSDSTNEKILEFRLPFQGYYIDIKRDNNAIKIGNGSDWDTIYNINRNNRLGAQRGKQNLKRYLLLKTAWEESNYHRKPRNIRYDGGKDLPSLILGANDKRDGNISRVDKAHHFMELTNHPALLYDCGSNNNPAECIYPELLPLIRELVQDFEENNSKLIKKLTNIELN